MARQLLGAMCLMLLLGTLARGRTYYVSPAGSDTNSGKAPDIGAYEYE